MADLPSSIVKINDIEVAANAPVTEALHSKIGSSINGLIDEQVSQGARIAVLEARVPNVVLGTLSAASVTSISVTITPTSSSNDILIFLQPGPSAAGAPPILMGAAAVLTLTRVVTTIMEVKPTAGGIDTITFNFLDSPAATIATTYTATMTGAGSFFNFARLVAKEIIL